MKQLAQCLKQTPNHPGHWEKRRFVSPISKFASNQVSSLLLQIKQLGLFYEPYYLQDLFDQSPGDRLYEVKLIERARNKNHGVKHYHVLDEVANSDPKTVIASEQNGFYVVHKDESVIFYSYSDPERRRC